MAIVKKEKKTSYWLIVFGLMLVSFIILKILQLNEPDNADTKQTEENLVIVNEQNQPLQVYLEVRASFSNSSIEIDKNGKLTYSQIVLGTPETVSENIDLTDAQLAGLQQEIIDTDFFNLSEAYQPMDLTLGSKITIVNIRLGENFHSVLCETDCPDQFSQLVEQIKSYWPNEFKILE
ncbi:hypothetical protein KKI23_03485 [Patescibacteria group bacterium]|nr:hypothetical protein [Patescibacteria group bacterium]